MRTVETGLPPFLIAPCVCRTLHTSFPHINTSKNVLGSTDGLCVRDVHSFLYRYRTNFYAHGDPTKKVGCCYRTRWALHSQPCGQQVINLLCGITIKGPSCPLSPARPFLLSLDERARETWWTFGSVSTRNRYSTVRWFHAHNIKQHLFPVCRYYPGACTSR